jgi:nicotinamidase-related amidase
VTRKAGFSPERSRDALLLIDVINDLDFDDGRKLLRAALPAARKIVTLKGRAGRAGVPIIYVNDNFGRWRSDFRQQVDHCLESECLGRPLAELLKPDKEDYFVLKPMHSGFYSTTLEVLLEQLGAERLILTGFATDLCVLYTANDAYMRDYELCVPEDCVAAETAKRSKAALEHIRQRLGADVSPAAELRFRRSKTQAVSQPKRQPLSRRLAIS